jgi:hypothetical protein
MDTLELVDKNNEPRDQFLESIAISLKRIADTLTECNEYGESGANAIARGIIKGLKGE